MLLTFVLLWISVYSLLFWLAFGIQKEYVSNFSPPVSVLIAAKNEAHNLEKHLPAILTQNYPQFEVIIAVNQTDDNTIQVLQNLQKKYPHLRWIEIKHIPANLSPKKYALTQAIEHSLYSYLVCTDADCLPNSSEWLKMMMFPFSCPKVEVVLGYSPYLYQNTWLSAWIQYETTLTALQYLGLARLGLPYMGVGRNIAYTKSLFYQHTFKKHQHIYSGDDDLFVNQAANRKNVAIQTHPKSWMWSVPPKNWQKWYQQKTRHISTGKHYKAFHLFILGMLALLNVLLPFFAFSYFLKPENFYIFALPFVGVYLIIALFYTRLKLPKHFTYLIFLPFLYSVYQIIFSIKGAFAKPKTTW
ncbi:MAG: glycosyltransferase [Bacteroidia bacterium]|nr:glycosyltransferase [Bacteroidia bacterium]MDW8302442.1 glycosyltransferase [Bacteroidia bacterium]